MVLSGLEWVNSGFNIQMPLERTVIISLARAGLPYHTGDSNTLKWTLAKEFDIIPSPVCVVLGPPHQQGNLAHSIATCGLYIVDWARY